jgi:hypothetical protein
MHPTVLMVLAQDHHAQLIRDAETWRRAQLSEDPHALRDARRSITATFGRLRIALDRRPTTSRAADLCCA